MDRHNSFYDVTVIGGGLHGAAIAADCAGRGLRTLICDQGDVGGSHNLVSARLFHCGLQYLQRGDLARVSESLKERAILARRASHIVHPTTVILPQAPGLTSRLKINTKAWLYKLVAGQEGQLEATNIAGSLWSEPLKAAGSESKHLPAIRFQDALLNDARLTIEHLLLAREKGAVILPYTELQKATRSAGNWTLNLQDAEHTFNVSIQSRCVINAAGPDAERVQRDVLGIKSRCSATRYNAGYIVVPKLFDGDQSYLIDSDEPHLIAAVPYLGRYTLVGPIIFGENGQLSGSSSSLEEPLIERLLTLLKRRFEKITRREDVISSFAVHTSAFKETPESTPMPFSQDYVLDFNCSDGRSPAVTLFGACVNMHRTIAEQVVEQVSMYLDDEDAASRDWTDSEPLPGAIAEQGPLDTLKLRVADQYPWLPESTLERWCGLYGERLFQILHGTKKLGDLGDEVLPSLYEKEIRWLHDNEWALTPEAVLWHRTKLGLTLSKAKVSEFNQWFIRCYRYEPALSGLHLHTQMNKEAS